LITIALFIVSFNPFKPNIHISKLARQPHTSQFIQTDILYNISSRNNIVFTKINRRPNRNENLMHFDYRYNL